MVQSLKIYLGLKPVFNFSFKKLRAKKIGVSKTTSGAALTSAYLQFLPLLTVVAIAFFPSCGVKKSPINESVSAIHSIDSYFKKIEIDKLKESEKEEIQKKKKGEIQ